MCVTCHQHYHEVAFIFQTNSVMAKEVHCPWAGSHLKGKVVSPWSICGSLLSELWRGHDKATLREFKHLCKSTSFKDDDDDGNIMS